LRQTKEEKLRMRSAGGQTVCLVVYRQRRWAARENWGGQCRGTRKEGHVTPWFQGGGNMLSGALMVAEERGTRGLRKRLAVKKCRQRQKKATELRRGGGGGI